METDKEILSRLKFIGRIRKGEKINVQHLCVQPQGIFTAISRFLFNQDNRSNTINFIQDTIFKAFTLLKEYKDSEEKSETLMSEYMVRDLISAKGGLNSLKQTYASDVKFCCDIDTLVQIIETKLYRESNQESVKEEKKRN